MIDGPGYYPSMPMAEYLADPCPAPALSTGIVQALLEQSPLHAWQRHPRLGGVGDEASSRGELGSAVHASVLGGQSVEYVEQVARRSGKEKGVPFVPVDWATKDAQDARDEIRARGGLPMLPHQRPLIEGAADSARRALERFGAGKPEVSMLWQDEGAWCRGRSDWLTDDGRYDIDIKTCDNAAPAPWIATQLLRGGYFLQAGLRARGHGILGQQRDVVFLVVELEPPHAVSLISMDPALADFADRQVQSAVAMWRECLRSNKWPGYRPDIHYADLPSWLEYRAGLKEVA